MHPILYVLLGIIIGVTLLAALLGRTFRVAVYHIFDRRWK